MTAAVMFGFTAIFANPVAPTAFVRLSEIQIVDSVHWTVEFVAVNAPLDSVTSKYFLVGKGFDPDYRPAVPVKENGYALITPSMYPNLQMHPGDTVNLRYDSGDAWDTLGETWHCAIDKTLKPTQSMAAYQFHDTIYAAGVGLYVQWCKDASPTLGFPNDSSGVFGVIRAFVCDKDSNPIPNIWAAYVEPNPTIIYAMSPYDSMPTNDSGYFYVRNLFSFNAVTFSFPGRSSKTFGPFSVEPACTLNVVCKLTDYAPSSAHNPVHSFAAFSLKVVGITKSKSDVLIIFNGSNSSGDYNLAVFSLSGKKMYSTTISNSGSGTYSVAWNGAHAGQYIARIRSADGNVERKFFLR